MILPILLTLSYQSGPKDLSVFISKSLAENNIQDAKNAIDYYIKTRGAGELNVFEQIALSRRFSMVGFRKNEKGDFEKTMKPARKIETRNDINRGIQENMDDLSKGKIVYAPPFEELKLGAIGHFRSDTVISPTVTQVIGKAEMTISFTVKTADKIYRQTVILKNYPTDDYVDGVPFDPIDAFCVCDTEVSKLSNGSTIKTFVIAPITSAHAKESSELVKNELGPIWEKMKKEDRDKAEVKAIENEMAKQKAAKEEAKKLESMAKIKANKASEIIPKLIRGLESYEKRFEDSFKETKESLMDQMQEQARTYIGGADKRLDSAIKEMTAAGIPEDEKARLVDQAKVAIAKAKKKVGIK